MSTKIIKERTATPAIGSMPLPTAEVLVDARCLQDPDFRDRGVGNFAASLLTGAKDDLVNPSGASIVALVDHRLPSLQEAHAALFDAQRSIAGAQPRNAAILVQPSPMTHSPNNLANLVSDPQVHSLAIVHDFIPLEQAGCYLSNSDKELTYFRALASLGDYETFVTNSNYTAMRLRQISGFSEDRIHVVGIPVRPEIVSSDSWNTENLYFLAVLGNDLRKNTELAVVAHAVCRSAQQGNVRLIVVGRYSQQEQMSLLLLHRDCGGKPELVEFAQGVSDGRLASLYAGALATICPSRSEGFSMPLVEANANRCPVLLSSCPAQTELVPQRQFQFAAEDYGRAAELMDRFASDPSPVREAALREQGHFWTRFRHQTVRDRFWGLVLRNQMTRSNVPSRFHISRGLKPRVAIISPVPPDRAGVADFTAATMAALCRRADLDLYTPTAAPTDVRHYVGVYPLTAEPYRYRRHDARLSVVGNSFRHFDIFNYLLDYGGGSIAHDARLVHFYVSMFGRDRTLRVASRELGREVSWTEIDSWLSNQRRMPILFLSELLDSSEPTFLHSRVTQKLIYDLYGRETRLLPFAIYRQPLAEFEGRQGRIRARALLEVDASEKLVITLGDVTEDKGLAEVVQAVGMLAALGIAVNLAVVGRHHPTVSQKLKDLACSLGLQHRVQFSDGVVSERQYQAYLAAADAAIQLRTHGFGGLSGAMLDCMSAALPVIANDELAGAMSSVSYVRAVPNDLTVPVIAEELRNILDLDRESLGEERQGFRAAYSIESYADRLMTGLGLV